MKANSTTDAMIYNDFSLVPVSKSPCCHSWLYPPALIRVRNLIVECTCSLKCCNALKNEFFKSTSTEWLRTLCRVSTDFSHKTTSTFGWSRALLKLGDCPNVDKHLRAFRWFSLNHGWPEQELPSISFAGRSRTVSTQRWFRRNSRNATKKLKGGRKRMRYVTVLKCLLDNFFVFVCNNLVKLFPFFFHFLC